MKRLVATLLVFIPLIVGAGCKHDPWPGPKPEAAAPSNAQPSTALVLSEPAPDHSGQAHPRILLTAARIATISAQSKTGAPEWQALLERCKEATSEKLESGYEGWDWAHASLSCALAYRVTRSDANARTALLYFKALLDDDKKVGDGKGGDDIVHPDDGYGIRTRGMLGAIAYDWLHDAAGMTPDLKRHAIDRFVAWTEWFKEAGYNHDKPISNYYAGYFGTVAFVGIGAEGDDARVSLLHSEARQMFGKELAPALKKLEGGDWPEGWQYGSTVTAVVAFYADAEGGRTLEQVPWLHQVVAMRAHALWPDGKHVFDNGDWEIKPASPSATELLAVALVLPASDPAAAQARFMAALAKNPKEDWPWLAVLAADRTKKAEDPRKGATSYIAPGTGTFFARTSWSSASVWFAVVSAPYLSDHQHADAGHFEVVRGGDPLIVDPAGYGNYATRSHNSLLVDDGKENLVYAPNQGSWGSDCGIRRFEDAGDFVYAQTDFTSAYNPDGYPGEHPARSVTRAERDAVFVRTSADSARIVLYDRVTLTKGSYGVTFALHGASAPVLAGPTMRILSGRSAATVTTLLPQGSTPTAVQEPSLNSDDAFTRNDSVDGAVPTRIEVVSPRGGIQRRFLHGIVVGSSAEKAVPATRIEGEGADGALFDTDAYVFSALPQSAAQPLSYRAPMGATRHVVVALAQGGRYAATFAVEGGVCRVSLGAGGALRASAQGVLVMAVKGCKGGP